ncbi:MAG: hypothetical protein IIU55_01120 [Paludibacteraceae bacterium]|nr:hypothetical protein [Paludibacteraceae bacterium]
MNKFLLLITTVFILNGCYLVEKRRFSDSVAEYNGKIITWGELRKFTAGLSPEDSARVAEKYIRQWAINLIEYDIAKDQTNKVIEQLVEDYRRSLYLHEYEEKLIAQRMPRLLDDSLIQAFYDQHHDQLFLPETILQGLLLIVPKDAPNMDILRKRIQQPNDEEQIEWIEKFAYQYAVGYELFLDEWKTANEIVIHMPFQKDKIEKQLKPNRQIELEDSVNIYLLQITDLHLQGTQTPLSYARKEIESVLLRQRQVDFVQNERERLYDEAIKQGKLKVYEQ